MVVDAYDTVTFGDNFEDSLIAGNVHWLEVCSRISNTYKNAYTYSKLPKYDIAWGLPLPKYVWRGEGGGDDGGAWVLVPDIPVAALARLSAPAIEGCSASMAAVAAEIGINTEDLQVAIGNALSDTPNSQACNACEKVMASAAILKDADGRYMEAMLLLFNEIAPSDQPYSPATGAMIASAMNDNRLNPDMPQYATAMEYIDAFVQYATVLDNELGSPVEDSMALVLEKYGSALGDDNANIETHIQAQLIGLGI
jgi:hypothetical protein